jgi:hypothetical protein
MVDMDEWYPEQREREAERARRARARAKRRKRQRRRDQLKILACVAAVAVMFFVVRYAARSGIGQSAQYIGEKLQTTEIDGGVVLEEDWVTVDLLPVNDYSRPGISLDKVNGIVIHYVGNPGTTAQQNRDYFAGLADNHATYASSHFVVGLTGEVVECVPLNEISYASNQRNDDTISIECCHPDENGQFTDETYRTLVRLIRGLCRRYNLGREDIIRHYDVTGKECPLYYVDHPDAWEGLLDDVFDSNFSVTG